MSEPAWIRTIDAADADDDLAALYARCVDPRTGALDHVLQVHGLHPAGLAAHLALYEAAMRPTKTLSKLDRELIAFVVSTINACHY